MDETVLLERKEVLNEIISKINPEDPRINRNKKFSLAEIYLLVLCAQLCNFTSFREYVWYGLEKLYFLRNFLTYENGIPSRSTIARVLALLDPKLLERLLAEWTNSIIPKNDIDQRVLAADGKTSCGVQNTKMHLVNVYDTNNGLCLGQEKVEDKSNEIIALPKLLEHLSIENQIVSADAMNCQKETAKVIIKKKADYFLALKRNHGDLYDDVKTYFEDTGHLNKSDFFQSIDKGHGRIETRKSYATDNIEWLNAKSEWENLKSIVMINSTRYLKGIETTETKYFLTSLEPNAQKSLAVSRAHWSIENS